MTTTLSVVIITFNEERNIARCLRSVEAVADEIIVVDSFSSDRTKEICLKYGVNFIENPFEGHIQQKNWAKNQANCDWVLSLDADEALDEKLIQSIINLKNNTVTLGYRMNRLTNYCGSWIRHSGWYPDTKLRLWKRNSGEWTGINPHDEFKLFEDTPTVLLEGNILHYSYYTQEDHDKQIEYFTTIAAKAHVENGKGVLPFQSILSAMVKFIKCYFIKMGLFDGKAGWQIAKKSSYAAYLKYVKINKLLKEKR